MTVWGGLRAVKSEVLRLQRGSEQVSALFSKTGITEIVYSHHLALK